MFVLGLERWEEGQQTKGEESEGVRVESCGCVWEEEKGKGEYD